jgi:hypothetical protein
MAHEKQHTAQTATQKLYEDLWRQHVGRTTSPTEAQKTAAICAMLTELAEGQGRDVSKALRGYVAALWELTPEELVLAFFRATKECRFFPPPATLLEFSGRAATGDPIANEAKGELLKILEAMRGPHGPKLKPILGRVLYGTEDSPRDEDGRMTHAPIRSESTPFPIARRTEAALVRLGWGDRVAGIALIAEHPSLKRIDTTDTPDQYRQNQLRASDEILKRFTDAYREVSDG